ncbi:MAG: hypothetical protein R3E86_21150 [Pseudomonadales bacterium]
MVYRNGLVIAFGTLVLVGCSAAPPRFEVGLREQIDAVRLEATTLAQGGWAIDADTMKEMSAVEAAARGDQAPLVRSFQEVAQSLDATAALNGAVRLALGDVTAASSSPAPAQGDLVRFTGASPTRTPSFSLLTRIENIRLVPVEVSPGVTRYALDLLVRYGLRAADTGAVIYDAVAFATRGPFAFTEWAENDGALFRTMLDQAYRQVAENTVDELLRVVRSPAPDAKLTEYATGYYLDPRFPPRIKRPFPVGDHEIGLGFAGTYELRDHQPELRWSAVPHRSKGWADDWAELGVPPEVLTYDVRRVLTTTASGCGGICGTRTAGPGGQAGSITENSSADCAKTSNLLTVPKH